MKRALFAIIVLASFASNFGCSCNRPWWRLCDCGGCGSTYYGDWQEGRPSCCECCDNCGNWCGGAPGYTGQGNMQMQQGGYIPQEGEQYIEQPMEQQAPTVAPLPAPQQVPAPAPAPQAQRGVRARPINGYRRPAYPPRSNYYQNQRVQYQQPRAQYD